MAEIYLTPNDINASDTRVVLALLNSVQSAEEIAARIEIPNELDIGVKLGQRILDARQELGGRFNNLQELMNVPLIGPERFTEVVTEALKKSALEILARSQQGSENHKVLALAAQLEALKQWANDFENLNPNRYRIELKTLDQTPYLGEVIPIRIRVWDRVTHKPKANLPLTIETNWGNLRWHKGLQLKQGAVITARTSVAGELVCHLYTPTIEPLTEPQQTSLSLALGKLTHGSSVPSEARESFQDLVALYQHPLNVDLRKAIDIHYKSRQERVSESINLPTAYYQWIYEQALVRVYAHPQDEQDKTTVLAMSALTVEYRDWLSPWHQVYKQSLIEGQELQDGLNQALYYSEDEHGVISHMVSSLHSFIARQHGLIGERIGQEAGKAVLTRMLRDNPETLSDNTRASLYTILTQAPQAITAASKGNVGIANEVALDVGRNSGIYDMVGDFGNVTGLLDELQSSYGSIDSRVDSLENVTAGVNFDQLTADLASFDSNYSNFTDNYSAFVNDYAQFNNNYSQFNSNYAQFNNNYTQFNNNYAQFNSNYADFNSNYADFNNNYANFNTNYTNFNNNYSNFNSNYADFNNSLNNWQVDYGDFRTSLDNFNVAKDQLINNVTAGVNNALSELESNVSATTGTRVSINPIENVNVGNLNRPGRG